MKKLRSILMKLYIRLHEKEKTVDSGIKVKYLFFRNRKSDRLIVVFSGWPLKKISTYNYVRTLKKTAANKLFILDSGGYNELGTYYLGNSCKLLEHDIIAKLVNGVRADCKNIKETVFAGSSKGATCALLYGLRMNVEKVICGSPQYRIAWYLQHSGKHQALTLPIILKDAKFTEEQIDALLEEAVKNANGNTEINMIYSSGEFLYPTDSSHLIELLKNSGLKCHLHDYIDKGFNEHSDVGKFFKPFLLKTLGE